LTFIQGVGLIVPLTFVNLSRKFYIPRLLDGIDFGIAFPVPFALSFVWSFFMASWVEVLNGFWKGLGR